MSTDSIQYRTEILDGRVELADGAVHASALNHIAARIFITHRPYWEGSRTQIPLTNASGTNNTSGLTINPNRGDSGYDNFANIAYNAIAGVLPAPLEIEIKNLSSTKQLKHIYIANDYDHDSSTDLITFLEGESGTASGSTTPSGSYSNGLARSFTVNTTNTLSWSITLLQIASMGGRNFKMLGRFTFTGTVYAKVSLVAGGITIASGPEIKLATQDYYQDLGVLAMPPGGESWTWATMTLSISFRSSSSVTVICDFVHITIADAPAYRVLTLVSDYSTNANDTIVDDGIENNAYLQSTTLFGRLPIVSALGNPVHVWPNNENQRLRFLIDGISTAYNWQFSVKAWYRPRLVLPV